MDSILALNFYEYLGSDAFMNEMAQCTASSAQFVYPIMTGVLDRTDAIAESGMPSNFHNHRRSMSPSLRLLSEFKGDSSDEKGRAGRSRSK